MAGSFPLPSCSSSSFNLPPKLIDSVCWVESKHDVTAIKQDDGPSDSYGVCQIKLETARWLGFEGTTKQLMRPEVNIHYAAKYLAHNLRRYRGDVTKAVIAYNRGNARGLTRTKYSDKVLEAHRTIASQGG